MKDREKLEKQILYRLKKIMLKHDNLMKMYQYAYHNHGFLASKFADIVQGRIEIQSVSNMVLYFIIKSYEKIEHPRMSIIKEHFSDQEIQDFSNYRIKNAKLDFPLYFDMVPVASDQWIGSIDSDMLNTLFDNNLVNYNPETQRNMKQVIRNGNEYYKITVNAKAVEEITNELLNDTYISDDITLNIPEPEEDFEYQKEEKRLVIYSIKEFDILDGYHRWLGITKARIKNEDFNYPMELRITHFNKEKAQKFIYQKDQKTKMPKVKSDSYNVFAPQIVVTTKINESSICNIRNYIGRNGRPIDMAKFADIIRVLFFDKPIPKTEERKKILEVSKELIEDFNIMTEEDTSFLDIKYDPRIIMCVLCVFKYMFGRENKSGVSNIVNLTIKESYNINKAFFHNSRKITKKTINQIMEIIERVIENV